MPTLFLDSGSFNHIQVSGSTLLSGSVIITGSLVVNGGSGVELQVTSTGVNLGNIIGDTHNITGSLNVSGSTNLNGNLIVSGNTTIGDATTDSITMNAVTMSLGSGGTGTLNIGSNLFVVNKTDNRVYVNQVAGNATFDVLGSINGSTVVFGAQQIGAGVSTAAASLYRLQNGTGNVTPLFINFGGIAAGNISTMIDNTNGFMIAAANGTHRIVRAGIQIANSVNTAGAETSDLLISTKPTNAGITERIRITGAGATIITGSLTVTTGSAVEFQVGSTGVTIGNIISDIHRITGSLNISGSLTATTIVPAGSNTQIQFNSASVLRGDAGLTYTLPLQSLQHGDGTAQATGLSSYTHGDGTISAGAFSRAVGGSSQAIGGYSYAMGFNTRTVGTYSLTHGNTTIASGSYQFVIGQFNSRNNTTDLFVIGGGSNDSNRRDVFNVSTSSITVNNSLIISSSLIFIPTASVAFNGEIVRFGAGTLTTGQLYFLSSSGTWSLANANSTGSSTGMLGLAVGSSPTTNGLLIRGFAASSSYTYGTGSIVYMATGSGIMTAASPSSSNHVVRVMGYQTTISNTIYFDPDKTWVTLA